MPRRRDANTSTSPRTCSRANEAMHDTDPIMAGHGRRMNEEAQQAETETGAAAAGFEEIGPHARRLPVVNRKGLHARASAKFVQTVERFDAEVTVTRCGETVGGRSIMGLLTLAAARGTTIDVAASGAQAQDVLDALTALLASRFGEDE